VLDGILLGYYGHLQIVLLCVNLDMPTYDSPGTALISDFVSIRAYQITKATCSPWPYLTLFLRYGDLVVANFH